MQAKNAARRSGAERGIRIECIHFASPPYTNAGVIENDTVALDSQRRVKLMGEKLTPDHLISVKGKARFCSNADGILTLLFG